MRKCSLLKLLIQHNKQRKVIIHKVRACDICAYQYSDKEREKFKADTIRNLTNLCAQYLANKMQAEEQLKRL